MNDTSFLVKITQEYSKLNNDKVLKKHQQYVVEFLKDHRGILVKHDLGSGKTMIASAAIAEYGNEYEVIILSPKSLVENLLSTLKDYANQKELEIPENFKFVTMNASNMGDQLKKATNDEFLFDLDMADVNFNRKFIIVDEAHNLFNSITNQSQNATKFYNAVMKAKDLKIMFLTGTPIINHPFELVPCYNMIAGFNILPPMYNDFETFFIGFDSIKNKAKFQNRIVGLTSYYGSDYMIMNSDDFPEELPTIEIRVKMSNYQYELYNNARKLEAKELKATNGANAAMGKPRGMFTSSYRRLSRQFSNFAYPRDAMDKKYNMFPEKITDDDLANLKDFSPKMLKLLENVKAFKGKQLIYSSFVNKAGIGLISRVFDLNGLKGKYFIISGGVENRQELVDIYNNENNKNGENVPIMIISSTGAEGLDLKGLQYIHIFEPYWNYSRIKQVIGRGVRYKSHIQLPKELWKVQPLIYLSDYPGKKKKDDDDTTDVSMYLRALNVDKIIRSFYLAISEASIDCALLNKNPKLNCRLCTPTGEKLYIPDIFKDMKVRSPCVPLKEETINAKEYVIDEKKYAVDGEDIFVYDESIDAYRELTRNDPQFAMIYTTLFGK